SRRARRTETWRPGAGQSAVDRGQQGSPFPQSADQGSPRKGAEERNGKQQQRWRRFGRRVSPGHRMQTQEASGATGGAFVLSDAREAAQMRPNLRDKRATIVPLLLSPDSLERKSGGNLCSRSEERRVGKECRSRWS